MNMGFSEVITTMSRSRAISKMVSSGTLPRTKTMHFISIISAVRTTWGLTMPVSKSAWFFT